MIYNIWGRYIKSYVFNGQALRPPAEPLCNGLITAPWPLGRLGHDCKHQPTCLAPPLCSYFSLKKNILYFVWLLQISTQILVFYHSFLSLLEEYIYCSFKALSQLQVKGSQSHLALWGFVDVKAPPNLDDPPRVEDHLPVVQGVAVLDHQGDFPPGKAAFQFRELSMLFFALLWAFARQQFDGGKGGALPKNATQIIRKQLVHPYQKKTIDTP